MEIETPTVCDSSKKDFSERGCWYCRQNPMGDGFFCLQPCVKRLRAENARLSMKITSLENRIKELRSEV